jgi:hypothetical protein
MAGDMMKVCIRLELCGEQQGEVIASIPLKILNGEELLPMLAELRKHLPPDVVVDAIRRIQQQQSLQQQMPLGGIGSVLGGWPR